jgi:hypothetical protein
MGEAVMDAGIFGDLPPAAVHVGDDGDRAVRRQQRAVSRT